MLTVGLTGGYASGKSFVAGELERLGCRIIYADHLGHAVLDRGGEAYAPTVDAFGPEILLPDSSIDRKKLASLVFHSPELLAKLTGFVHPAVIRLESQMLQEFEAQSPNGIAVIEAAILVETGRYKAFDRLVLTACSEETQVTRAMKRDGVTRQEVLERTANQMPLDEKKRYADYVISTDGPKEATAVQVRQVYEQLKEAARSQHA